jgi:hypothetical protein
VLLTFSRMFFFLCSLVFTYFLFFLSVLSFFYSHSCSHPSHIHQLEWIGVHPDGTGKGCGSFLIKWAHDYSREFGAKCITLSVMNANRAKGLYERKGYEYYGETGCVADSFTACCIYIFMGCRYCKVKQMKKDLTKDDDESGEMKR